MKRKHIKDMFRKAVGGKLEWGGEGWGEVPTAGLPLIPIAIETIARHPSPSQAIERDRRYFDKDGYIQNL